MFFIRIAFYSLSNIIKAYEACRILSVYLNSSLLLCSVIAVVIEGTVCNRPESVTCQKQVASVRVHSYASPVKTVFVQIIQILYNS